MLQAQFGDGKARRPQQQEDHGDCEQPERTFDHIGVVARILWEGKGGYGGTGGFTPPDPRGIFKNG
ncbi:hypothetical protein GCM10010873_06480 [Cypionkella aquatica]|uniref:Uncharacterized protein n=1 Tax=Cypionkella aquatica TaxID=1756042 RepID=A0AA37U0K7_9RHOB|nr:hypothetical protein GCM10010873_06480 [Cypionkella aquatica]